MLGESSQAAVLTGRRPQLDGLRALAVAGVAWHHWAPAKYHYGLPWGSGVSLFFVLSGFLITGLLLDARAAAEASAKASVFRVWRNFYLRRTLRLFPLYYVVLGCVTVGGIVRLDEDFGWHFFYATNFYVIARGEWIGYPSHLWTLAVEEQFYLCWPLLVLLVPIRRMFASLILVTLTGLTFGLVASVWFSEFPMLGLATPAQFFTLGLGAIVAWLVRYPVGWWHFITRHRTGIISMLGAIWSVLLILPSGPICVHVSGLLLGAIFGLVVHGAAQGFSGWIGQLLQGPFLGYIGRISYGVYLWHNFVAAPTSMIFRACPWLGDVPGSIYLVKAGCTFGLAALSWHLLEKPINDSKRFFPYSTRRP